MNEDAVNFARPMPNWQPLVEYRRNGVAENTIHGAISWVSGKNLIYSFGGNVEVYGRSMVKPVMMKVFVREFARALGPDGELRLWSCETGAGKAGETFIEGLAEATGANGHPGSHQAGVPNLDVAVG